MEGPTTVALGASAGGLEALRQFFDAVPADSPLAYLVVQHLPPAHETLLPELLQRHTGLRVRQAREPMRLEGGHVYIAPPGCWMTVHEGRVQPRQANRAAVPAALPVDELFASLARARGPQAIAVVLSGMGHDGSQGVRAVRGAGGWVLAQTPESAAYGGMPQSAIDTLCVDRVGPPQELARAIAEYAGAPLPLMSRGGAGEALESIVAALREHCRQNFSHYKPSTLLRRAERRMLVHGLDDIQAYAALLADSRQEAELLFKELLIGVTRFFRDTAVWQRLRDKALPALIERHAGNGRMRAWVAGCSTGEEAYSLAVVFKEALAEVAPGSRMTVQIFATDLSADAIRTARRGEYPASIGKDVSAERLERFFERAGDGWRVGKEIREMVLFATHNLTTDPPFTKLDLLSCRNLLIYFDAALQHRLVPLFHYCLSPGGLLMLGSSETVGRFGHLFSSPDPKLRLYERNVVTADASPLEFPLKSVAPPTSTHQELPVYSPNSPHINLQALADHLLLQEFAPSAVLVNEAGDILYISGRTGKYLEPAAGKANWNVHVMAREGLRTPLASALRQLRTQPEPLHLKGLLVDGMEGGMTVDVVLRPIVPPSPLKGMVMIVFRDVPRVAGRRRRHKPDEVQAELESQLQRAREEIQALREEMRTSREELQAANEELQSTNEELQSANEELTTSKEEMESMNEELQAINAELQSKLDDLALAQSDMKNLLNSTDIATLFLDNALNVRRFTDQATRIINLREGDVGRPLSDLTTQLRYEDMVADVQHTLHHRSLTERQVAAQDGRWYSVRIMPYRTSRNRIDGAVLTFVDITAAKTAGQALEQAAD
ncbi:MAG: chemotaxis protein CheB [Pseudomonadota bacterium]